MANNGIIEMIDVNKRKNLSKENRENSVSGPWP
jgi:hypothetical protein